MPKAWQQKLNRAVTSYGHRNWIVIADSAFPQLNAAGLKTVVTGAEQGEVLAAAMAAVAAAPHVQANVYVDAELGAVPDEHAPGIAAFRATLQALAPQAVSQPHEQLIARLDEVGEVFAVLLLKTTSILPYTTVFLELDCGYWDAEREAALRAQLGQA